jgi:hypothetical protein
MPPSAWSVPRRWRVSGHTPAASKCSILKELTTLALGITVANDTAKEHVYKAGYL